MARYAGLSPYYFLRTFERVTGITPHQYVMRARLREAATRLVAEPGNVLDIALDCGCREEPRRGDEEIDRDAVSYEHQAPLQYNGADAIREACRRGFEAMPGFVRWDIPDLQVIVRDDIAVTWGLNRMRSQESGGHHVEVWSRGTRVFQRIGGKWKMIHQHVSLPSDLETRQARIDLKP
jgi:ketosteroid isomerase-like protein